MLQSVFTKNYDLITPDGKITALQRVENGDLLIKITIENIDPSFIGFHLEPQQIIFNLKSTLAQIGIEALTSEIFLDPKRRVGFVNLRLISLHSIGKSLLELLCEGAYIGKLFAKDPSRRVRDPDYLNRMFGRTDLYGDALLSFGGIEKDHLLLEKVEGRTIARIPLLPGDTTYISEIIGFLPLLAKSLHYPDRFQLRDLLKLQHRHSSTRHNGIKKGQFLLVKTAPLHIRTAFAHVVEELLPNNYHHTSASILEPETKASGDIYEFYGESTIPLQEIPLEFYTLQPFREYVFFSDRDQLQNSLEDANTLFKVFETIPQAPTSSAATFIVKGQQLLNLTPDDWISCQYHEYEPKDSYVKEEIDRHICEQPFHPFLKAIENNSITSQGVLFTSHFPSPLMKHILLSNKIKHFLKRIYFQQPSMHHGDFFSHDDRTFLLDLAKSSIPVFWVDQTSKKILQYIPRVEKDAGMFVPIDKTAHFSRATFFGLYGSNLLTGSFEKELTALLQGILKMRDELDHPLLHHNTPLALVTGGGPGAMEIGNCIAKKLDILSCANIVDLPAIQEITDKHPYNPYIDIKMTYRLERLVERQAEFHLDFPILVIGGIGTDFEFALENVLRKIHATPPTPVLLFGEKEYWKDKITPCFQRNLKSGTIKGTEWTSNCFYCVQNAEQAIEIYRKFFTGTLPLGKGGPIYKDGFVIS